MPHNFRRFGYALALLAALYVAAPARADVDNAQPAAPTINKLTVNANGVPTVYYIVQNGSPRLQAVYRTLQYAENEMTLVEQLQQLKFDYMRNERLRESQPGTGVNYNVADAPAESSLKSGLSGVLTAEATPEAAVKAIKMLEQAENDAANELKQLAPKDRQALDATTQQMHDFAAQYAP